MESARNLTSYAQSKVDDWLQFWNWALSISDPRVKDWLFMGSVWPTVYLTIAYIVIANVGPKIMEKRKPLDLKPLMIVYNFAMVMLSVYMWGSIMIGAIRRNYSLSCTPIKYSLDEEDMRIAGALWWFYFSKFIEYADTLIFILRKKNSQISFLHVYHHATMFPLWWIGVKWVAGGQSFMPAMLNSFVHTVMYTYYGLSACGPSIQPYLWWKKYLTKLQLGQFFICLVSCVNSLYVDCDFPRWMHYALLLYAFSLIVLFLNFYVHAYIKGKSKKSQPNANGVAHLEESNQAQTAKNGANPLGTEKNGKKHR